MSGITLSGYYGKHYLQQQYPLTFAAVHDMDAYSLYKEACFAYNKLWLSHVQHVDASPAGLNIFARGVELVRKPIYNLAGMAVGTKIITSDDISAYKDLGCMYMPYLTGIHMSLDYVVSKGRPILLSVWRGDNCAGETGVFRAWEEQNVLLNDNTALLHIVDAFIAKWLPNYNGMMNVETIGKIITECHLRPGDVTFLPLYRQNSLFRFTEAVLGGDEAESHIMMYTSNLSSTGVVRYWQPRGPAGEDIKDNDDSREYGYILPLYAPCMVPAWCSRLLIARLLPLVFATWQHMQPLYDVNIVCEYTQWQPQPPTRTRLCLLNTTTRTRDVKCVRAFSCTVARTLVALIYGVGITAVVGISSAMYIMW